MGMSIIIRVIDQAWGQAILTEQVWLITDFSVIDQKKISSRKNKTGNPEYPHG